MDPLAVPEDVAADWGELGLDEEDQVRDWIKQLTVKLQLIARGRRIDLDALLASDELAREGARIAIVNAVRNRLRNPQGFLSFSETTGPFSRSGTRAPRASEGDLEFDPADLAHWLVPRRRQRIGAFTVRTGFR